MYFYCIDYDYFTVLYWLDYICLLYSLHNVYLLYQLHYFTLPLL